MSGDGDEPRDVCEVDMPPVGRGWRWVLRKWLHRLSFGLLCKPRTPFEEALFHAKRAKNVRWRGEWLDDPLVPCEVVWETFYYEAACGERWFAVSPDGADVKVWSLTIYRRDWSTKCADGCGFRVAWQGAYGTAEAAMDGAEEKAGCRLEWVETVRRCSNGKRAAVASLDVSAWRIGEWEAPIQWRAALVGPPDEISPEVSGYAGSLAEAKKLSEHFAELLLWVEVPK